MLNRGRPSTFPFSAVVAPVKSSILRCGWGSWDPGAWRGWSSDWCWRSFLPEEQWSVPVTIRQVWVGSCQVLQSFTMKTSSTKTFNKKLFKIFEFFLTFNNPNSKSANFKMYAKVQIPNIRISKFQNAFLFISKCICPKLGLQIINGPIWPT